MASHFLGLISIAGIMVFCDSLQPSTPKAFIRISAHRAHTNVVWSTVFCLFVIRVIYTRGRICRLLRLALRSSPPFGGRLNVLFYSRIIINSDRLRNIFTACSCNISRYLRISTEVTSVDFFTSTAESTTPITTTPNIGCQKTNSILCEAVL